MEDDDMPSDTDWAMMIQRQVDAGFRVVGLLAGSRLCRQLRHRLAWRCPFVGCFTGLRTGKKKTFKPVHVPNRGHVCPILPCVF